MRIFVSIIWSAFLIIGSAIYIQRPLPREDLAYIQCIDWLKENSNKDDLILARKPGAIWFYTGRKAISYPSSSDPKDWNQKARYIVRDKFVIGIPSYRYVDEITSDTTLFAPVFVSDILSDVKIYERRERDKNQK